MGDTEGKQFQLGSVESGDKPRGQRPSTNSICQARSDFHPILHLPVRGLQLWDFIKFGELSCFMVYCSDQKQLGQERVYLAYMSTLHPIAEGSQRRISRQEPAKMPWRSVAHWIAPPAFIHTPGPPAQRWPHPPWAGLSHMNY